MPTLGKTRCLNALELVSMVVDSGSFRPWDISLPVPDVEEEYRRDLAEAPPRPEPTNR